MKKILTLFFVLSLGITTATAQETSKKAKKAKATVAKVEGAGMVFVNETIDYGTIARNSDGKRGAKGVIGVKYATERPGPFTKTVTITSNANGQPTKTLTIKGNVLPDEVKS